MGEAEQQEMVGAIFHWNFGQHASSPYKSLILTDSFLPAAKRHGHVELQVEKKETLAFLVIVTSVFGVFWYFSVLL